MQYVSFYLFFVLYLGLEDWAWLPQKRHKLSKIYSPELQLNLVTLFKMS